MSVILTQMRGREADMLLCGWVENGMFRCAMFDVAEVVRYPVIEAEVNR